MATILATGANGPAVRALQQDLNRVLEAGLKEDGDFGPATKAAVIRFQQLHGLEADGQVGPKTFAKIAELTAPTPPRNTVKEPPAPPPASPVKLTVGDIARAVWEYQYAGYPMQNHLHATTLRVEQMAAGDGVLARLEALRAHMDQRFEEARAELAKRGPVSEEQVLTGVRNVLRSALD